jgi:hypothetical protein
VSSIGRRNDYPGLFASREFADGCSISAKRPWLRASNILAWWRGSRNQKIVHEESGLTDQQTDAAQSVPASV